MTEGQEALTHKVDNSDGSILNSDPWTDCKALSIQVTGKSQLNNFQPFCTRF